MNTEHSSEPAPRLNREGTDQKAVAKRPVGTIVGHSAGPVGGAAPQLSPAEIPILADYEFIRHLGGGGMGVVYLYRNVLMDRLEVLKVLSQNLVNQPQAIERFLREIQSAAQLNHRNIVRAYSAIRWNNGLILAMEYVEGQDLAARVENLGPMSVAEACSCIYQAAKGLQHAAIAKMVHRDIKPANLILDLVREKGVVKILDFGLAKVTSEGPVEGGITRQGFLLGSPDYMAPEQIRNPQSADDRADIYSLGCTLYYLLSGGPPFDGNSLYDILQAHHSIEANPLDAVRNDVPLELAALAAKMMAKNPDDRFQTAAAVADAILPFFRPNAGSGSGMQPAAKTPQALPPILAGRNATVIEEFPLIDLVPSGRSVGNRARTRMEMPLPERLGTRTEPDFEKITATPSYLQPRIMVSIGVAVMAVVALVAGLATSMKHRPDRIHAKNPTVVTAPTKSAIESKKAGGFGGMGSNQSAPRFPLGNPIAANQPTAKASNLEVLEARRKAKAAVKSTELPNKPNIVVAKAGLAEKPMSVDTPEPKPGPNLPRDADGYVRVDYRELIQSPERYEGMKVIPKRFFNISSKIFEEEKNVAGYVTLVVKNADELTLTTEYGKPKISNGPSFVLDKQLAQTYREFLADCMIKPEIDADLKIVPTLELRPSKQDGTNGWLAVIIAMDVKVAEKWDKVIDQQYDDAFLIFRLKSGRIIEVDGQGQDWYNRLGGEKERSRVKKLMDNRVAAQKRKQKNAILNEKAASITIEGIRAGSRQQQDAINQGQRFFQGR